MKYSLIIPVYNRPDEVDELLESLIGQTFTDFETVVVEDGSSRPCRDVVEKYAGRLSVKYYDKPNSGPGQTRNYGAERSSGEYLIVLDSDCVLPPGYLQAVDDELRRDPADAFGGPDRAHESFTDVQKAISYAMTSFFTTGGIRAPSTWESGRKSTAGWEAFPKCVLARTSISASGYSRPGAVAVCFPMPGCGTSGART